MSAKKLAATLKVRKLPFTSTLLWRHIGKTFRTYYDNAISLGFQGAEAPPCPLGYPIFDRNLVMHVVYYAHAIKKITSQIPEQINSNWHLTRVANEE